MSKITDKKILTKYVSGFVLGDGGLSNLNKSGAGIYNTTKNSKYYLKQTDEHLDYVEWQASILENITSISIIHTDNYVDNRGYHCKGQYALTTKCNPFFTTLRNRLYLEGKKVIDPHYLKLIDFETLATMYMDDGWLETKQTQTRGLWVRVSIATMAYSYADNMLLRDYIAETFGIHFNVNFKTAKSGELHYYLRNTKDNANRFLDSISKYVLPSYQYKLERLAPIEILGDDIV